MKGITKHIPNMLTCVSLAFGFYASILGIHGNYHGAMIAIFIAAVFDFADGLAARLLKAYSPLGKELDSLADMVSFGVAPGMMLFCFIDKLLYHLSWNESYIYKLLLLSAFAIPIFSALRLAKFNIDTRQTTSFLGLPVPAHAIFWSALIVVFSSSPDISPTEIPFPEFSGLLPLTHLITAIPHEALLIILSVSAIVISILLVSEIPMFSLKLSSFSWSAAKLQYILIISAIILIVLFGTIGISATILLYVLLSVLSKKFAG